MRNEGAGHNENNSGISVMPQKKENDYEPEKTF